MEYAKKIGNLVLLIVSIIGVTPLLKNIVIRLKETKYGKAVDYVGIVCLMGLLILTTAFLIDASFNPFLYFRF